MSLVVPMTVLPGEKGCRVACARAATTGLRTIDAAATAALSMTRLITMLVTSFVTSTGSTATSAIFHASWPSRGRSSSLL